jgi:hypothetical protein
MKTHALLAIIFIVITDVLPASDPILELIARQQKTLAEQGINGFVETAKIEQWNAPRVKSKWAIERITDKDEKARMVAYFEFGRRLLLALPQLAKNKDNADALAAVIRMADFADWAATQHCYGNALIAKRAFDLALPLAGQLIVDPGTSQETLTSLEQHLRPSWSGTSFAAAVLDGEAQCSLFSDANDNDDLRSIWREGARRALEKSDANWSKAVPDGFLKAPVAPMFRITDKMVPFFRDDPLPSMPTTEALLNGKHHEIIVVGIEPSNATRLRDLMSFRSALTSFPTDTVKSEFYPGLKGAFDEAWRRHYQANSPKGLSIKLGLAAWAAYDVIRRKQMLPEDEEQLLQR